MNTQIEEEFIVTSRQHIINVLTDFSYDLSGCLLEIINNENLKDTTKLILESSLYWISKLAYRNKNKKIMKLTEKEYRRYLFTFNKNIVLKDINSYNLEKYNMFVYIFTHILNMKNILLDAPEFMMLIDSIKDQKEIVKPRYKNKNSIYPYNMSNINFKELEEFRKTCN